MLPFNYEPTPKGVAGEGVTFVWCISGAVRVFEDGEEIPRVLTVSFDVVNDEQVAFLQHVLPNGSVMARRLEPPYKSAYEKGLPHA